MIPQRQEHIVPCTRSCGTADADIIMVNYVFTDIPLAEEIMLLSGALKIRAYDRYDLAAQILLSVRAEFRQGQYIYMFFHPVLIKFLAPVPPLCCRMTSSSVMMQSPGPGRQARPVEAESKSPPIMCQPLQVAARRYSGQQCRKCIK